MKTVGPLLLINGQLWDPRRGKFISSADPAVEAHVARSDPHTQYRLESEGHSHQSVVDYRGVRSTMDLP